MKEAIKILQNDLHSRKLYIAKLCNIRLSDLKEQQKKICKDTEDAILTLKNNPTAPDKNIRIAYNRLFLARLTEFLDEKLDQMEKLPYGPDFRKVVDDAATLSGALEILKNEIKDIEEKQNENN